MNKENIRRIPLAEKDIVVNFLNENWGSAHPLVNNSTLFDYYYLDGDMTNFYVLSDDDGPAAVCGYIKCAQKEHSDIWISIWCAKKGKNGLGLALMGAMKQLTGADIMACNNIKPNTMPFYTFLGYYPGKLDHYYRLADLEKYSIALVKQKNIPFSHSAEQTTLVLLENIRQVKECFEIPAGLKPAKDFWYINKRYFRYPHYEYLVFAVKKENHAKALAVFRVNISDEGKVLRLVDFIGKPSDFCLLSGQIDPLMAAYGCEYCDMYCRGINGEKAGFVKREADENIIPNYLNPLLQKNIDYYYFTTDNDGFTMFKADGDQDRKNLG